MDSRDSVVPVKEVVMSKDPVCNMDVDTKKADASSEYQGKIYYFCSAACKQVFDANTHRYLKDPCKANQSAYHY